MGACIESTLKWIDGHPAIGTLPQWVTALAAIAAFCLALYSARWAIRQWRTQYLTQEWCKTIDFLHANSKYLDSESNARYKDVYASEDAARYQLVARRSIAYVDDLFNLNMDEHFNSWLKGSMKVFVRPHLQWFKDNKSSYSNEFHRKTLELLSSSE
jgi:hypothetical protein